MSNVGLPISILDLVGMPTGEPGGGVIARSVDSICVLTVGVYTRGRMPTRMVFGAAAKKPINTGGAEHARPSIE
jgi:hypothetical protein